MTTPVLPNLRKELFLFYHIIWGNVLMLESHLKWQSSSANDIYHFHLLMFMPLDALSYPC
jgi:hypothetical protein